MAITDNLLSDFKAFLDIIDDTSNDELLLSILNMSENFIYDYYGVSINLRELNERVSLNYGNIWYLKKSEIIEIVNVTINGSDIDNQDLVNFYYERNQVYLPNNFIYKPTDRIFVDYKVGFLDADEVPYGLKMGLFILGKKILNDSQKDTDSYAQITSGVKESVKLLDEIPLMADNLLTTYRVFRL